ncbi:F-box family protein [Thalictrum thalictroides]|uniref:F-box family protein n=1 Tax=Thalictrum thalictroides TaxID=46969 RepID=A0A7J6V8D2_THATH|nr:F-box family protein [Thalictrum thalictroides]
MEYNEDKKWFDGVTWVHVCTEAGNNITKIPCIVDVYSNEIEQTVDGVYELKLGLLLVFPIGIVFDILSRLPVEDLIRGRIICKSWYKLTKDPYFIHLQVSKTIHRPCCFLLQQTTVNSEKKLVLIDSENDKWRSKEISLEGFNQDNIRLSNSCNGLICVSSNGRGLVIYNLLTKESLPLPNSDYKPHHSFPCTISGFALGFDSLNKKYKVVRVYNIYHDVEALKFHTKAEVITLGESSWRMLNFPHKVTTSSIEKPVFLNGALHWLLHREKDCSHLEYVLAFDCMKETFETINLPPVEMPENLDLINLGDTLALSELGRFNCDVNVLRIWQIVGSRRDGGRLCQYSFDKSFIHGHFNQELHLQGMLSNGDFLYKALETGNVGASFGTLRYHLVCYCPQKKTGFSLEVPDIPISFRSTLFVPSLASPNILS